MPKNTHGRRNANMFRLATLRSSNPRVINRFATEDHAEHLNDVQRFTQENINGHEGYHVEASSADCKSCTTQPQVRKDLQDSSRIGARSGSQQENEADC
jgi:hypothetical protein